MFFEDKTDRRNHAGDLLDSVKKQCTWHTPAMYTVTTVFFCNSSHRLTAKRIPVSGQTCFSSGLLPECNLSGLIIHALHDCKGLHADSL